MQKFLNQITFCLTSCNRNDLLFATMDSFLNTNSEHNSFIAKWYIKEDSGIESVADEIRQRYPFVEVISGDNIGQGESIDLLYRKVRTRYIFHCEEDWFFSGNKDFLVQSLEILERNINIHQVWLRKNMQEWADSYTIYNNFEYAIIKDKHLEMWNGFTWNPGLRRLIDYRRMFPRGYKQFAIEHKSGAKLEYECMLNTRKFNYRAAILKDCVCEHIGDNKSTTQ